MMTSSWLIFTVFIHHIIGHVECSKLDSCWLLSEASTLNMEVGLHGIVSVILSGASRRIGGRCPGLLGSVLQVSTDTIVSGQWSSRVKGFVVLDISDVGFGLCACANAVEWATVPCYHRRAVRACLSEDTWDVFDLHPVDHPELVQVLKVVMLGVASAHASVDKGSGWVLDHPVKVVVGTLVRIIGQGGADSDLLFVHPIRSDATSSSSDGTSPGASWYAFLTSAGASSIWFRHIFIYSSWSCRSSVLSGCLEYPVVVVVTEVGLVEFPNCWHLLL